MADVWMIFERLRGSSSGTIRLRSPILPLPGADWAPPQPSERRVLRVIALCRTEGIEEVASRRLFLLSSGRAEGESVRGGWIATAQSDGPIPPGSVRESDGRARGNIGGDVTRIDLSSPALPLTLNRLVIRTVGLTCLPMMQQDCSSGEGRRASCSSSHPALSELTICDCPNLTSLDGFMLQQQYFPDLEELYIVGCASVTSLPPAEVFPRLSSLRIWNCEELSSLAGLHALPSLKLLCIGGCDKLIELSPLQPPLLDLTSTSHTDMLLRPSMRLETDRQSLLRIEPLRNLNSVSELTLHGGTELASSLDEQWLLQNRNSLECLAIYGASSLKSLPPSMIDLRSLRSLSIHEAYLLETIPELPTSMEHLRITDCRPELKEYIKGSGKFSNIPYMEVEEQSEDEEEQWEDAEE